VVISLSIAFPAALLQLRAVRLQFLAKYREFGLLLLRVSLGALFIVLIAPVLTGGASNWARFGAGMGHFGIHSHLQACGFVAALVLCAAAVLMIFGLFFRLGVLFCLVAAAVHAFGAMKGAGFRAAFPAIELGIVLLSVLFIGPGKYSVDKT
jgi:putative oxidoreductase